MRKAGAVRNPTNCFKRGHFANQIWSDLVDLPHEIKENDKQQVAVILARAGSGLYGLAQVSTKRDAVAAMQLERKIRGFIPVFKKKGVSKKAKVAAARALVDDVRSLHRKVARSCNA